MSRLTVITRPALEPVTADEVKTHTHVSHSAEDALIASWIKSARELAEGYQRRAYITQTLELSFDEFPETPLYLPRSPLISVVSVTYTDYLNADTVIAAADYIVDTGGEPGRIDLAYSAEWPVVTLRSLNSVRIRFTAGYGASANDVPANVKDAIMLYCAYRYNNRQGQEQTGDVSDIPETFWTLLRHDRIYMAGRD